MNDILIFGSLPSGLGGMEKVFSKFSLLFNNADFRTKFYFYSLNTDNNLDWLAKDIKYTLFCPNSKFRLRQKFQTMKRLSLYLTTNPPNVIISYDPLSIYLIKRVVSKLKLNIPIYSWIHFSLTEYKKKYINYTTLADKHLVLCDDMKEQFIKLNVKSFQINVIYNPISPQRITIAKPKKETNTFLYIGRLQYGGQKNVQELFVALSKIKHNFMLHIIGDGDDKDKLKKLAEQLNIDKYIHWHGWQSSPWDYVIKNIKSVTALILSSTYEGFGMVLCEAISYGIYCISSNCKTGPCDIINKDNGILYELGNTDDLAECLQNANNLASQLSANTIKESIIYLYDENYYHRVKAIFQHKNSNKGP